ncbi:MAG: glycoside hydrolase family 27 protein, partial [Bryobacteraceae bacterium]
MKRISALLFTIALTASAWGADLTGHWVVETHNDDGTTRKTFLILKQDGVTLTGKVGATWADLDIREGSVQGDKVSFVVAYGHPPRERLVHWTGAIDGDQLHLTEARGRRAPEQMVAKRASGNEGDPPEKLPVPELHEVPYNGLAKTPQMGWNSWNHFAGKIDDKTVREIADAMVANGMKAAGYIYVNIDDTWELDRDANG